MTDSCNIINGRVTGVRLGTPMQDATPSKPEENDKYYIDECIQSFSKPSEEFIDSLKKDAITASQSWETICEWNVAEGDSVEEQIFTGKWTDICAMCVTENAGTDALNINLYGYSGDKVLARAPLRATFKTEGKSSNTGLTCKNGFWESYYDFRTYSTSETNLQSRSANYMEGVIVPYRNAAEYPYIEKLKVQGFTVTTNACIQIVGKRA